MVIMALFMLITMSGLVALIIIYGGENPPIDRWKANKHRREK